MTKTLASILLVALFAVSTALAGPYTDIPVVTSGVLTNGATTDTTINRKVGPIAGSTIGVQTQFALMAAGAGTNHIAFQRSYDGTNNWQPVLYFQSVANGTTAVPWATNFTLGDFGYVRTFVTNSTGGTITNLSIRLFHK